MEKIYKCTVRIRLPSNEHAVIMRDALEVDEELQPARITRELVAEDSSLVV